LPMTGENSLSVELIFASAVCAQNNEGAMVPPASIPEH